MSQNENEPIETLDSIMEKYNQLTQDNQWQLRIEMANVIEQYGYGREEPEFLNPREVRTLILAYIAVLLHHRL